MTIALTRVEAKGVEVEEALNKKYIQYLMLTFTAANTDLDIDLGDFVSGSLGNFWDAVDGSSPGDEGIQACRNIQNKAESFIGIGGTPIAAKQKMDPTTTTILSLVSSAAAGGGATESYTVTGLLTTDTILAVTQSTVNGTATSFLISYDIPADVNDDLDVTYSADPGAGGKVNVAVARTGAAAATAGSYVLAMDATATHFPNLTFVTGDAPTAGVYVLSWILKEGEEPEEVVATA